MESGGEKVIPPFLARLGLDAQADERTIRRTYARLLKQTDQETNPEGFQALREAYEIAMVWRQRQSLGAPGSVSIDIPAETGSVDSTQTPPAADGAPVAQDDGAVPGPTGTRTAGDLPGGLASQPSAERIKAAMVRNAEQLARDGVDALRSKLEASGPKERTAVSEWLEVILDDPRMADMDARFLFEGGVVMTLAEGWMPGHELLFGPAIEHFGWKNDRGRLAAFGRGGEIVATAIAELEFFDSQTDAIRSMQRDLIRSLRAGKRPTTSALLKQSRQLDQIAQLYPHWLHIITDTQAIARWREWSSQIPGWRRWLTREPRPARGRRRASAPSLPYGWVLAVMVSVGALLRIFESSPPAPPSASPAYSGTASGIRQPGRTGEPSAGYSPVNRLLGNAQPGSTLPLDSYPRFPGPSTTPSTSQTGAGRTLPTPLAHAAAAYTVPPRPVYPGAAKRTGRQGRVVLTTVVEADGRVRETTVHESSGYQDLDEAAATAVRNAVFIPAKDHAGRPISATYSIPFNFKLSDSEVASQSSAGSYALAVSNAVRPHIIFGDKVVGNPAAELTLRLAEDGRIEDYRLTKSSGSDAWDLAVVRAIQRVPRIPSDGDGKVPRQMIIAFRPKA